MRRISWMLLSIGFLLLGSLDSFGEDYGKAPAKLQAALFLKVLAFDKGRGGGKDLTICVIGDEDFAKFFSNMVGKKIGASQIKKVLIDNGPPSEAVDIVYLGDSSKVEDVIKFTRDKKVLSITGEPTLVEKGITLGVGVSGGKLKVLLNLEASKEEGVAWNPAILKIAVKVK